LKARRGIHHNSAVPSGGHHQFNACRRCAADCFTHLKTFPEWRPPGSCAGVALGELGRKRLTRTAASRAVQVSHQLIVRDCWVQRNRCHAFASGARANSARRSGRGTPHGRSPSFPGSWPGHGGPQEGSRISLSSVLTAAGSWGHRDSGGGGWGGAKTRKRKGTGPEVRRPTAGGQALGVRVWGWALERFGGAASALRNSAKPGHRSATVELFTAGPPTLLPPLFHPAARAMRKRMVVLRTFTGQSLASQH